MNQLIICHVRSTILRIFLPLSVYKMKSWVYVEKNTNKNADIWRYIWLNGILQEESANTRTEWNTFTEVARSGEMLTWFYKAFWQLMDRCIVMLNTESEVCWKYALFQALSLTSLDPLAISYRSVTKNLCPHSEQTNQKKANGLYRK